MVAFRVLESALDLLAALEEMHQFGGLVLLRDEVLGAKLLESRPAPKQPPEDPLVRSAPQAKNQIISPSQPGAGVKTAKGRVEAQVGDDVEGGEGVLVADVDGFLGRGEVGQPGDELGYVHLEEGFLLQTGGVAEGVGKGAALARVLVAGGVGEGYGGDGAVEGADPEGVFFEGFVLRLGGGRLDGWDWMS